MASVQTSKRPNILLIVTDQQQSFVDLPRELPLPAHERLLERGVGFKNYHVNTTPCGPSRSVMYTGRHTQTTGVNFNPNVAPHPQLKPELKTIGHRLRALGYTTAYKGKWHLSLFGDHKETDRLRPDMKDALEPFGFADFNFDGDHTGHTWAGMRQDRTTAGDAANLLAKLSRGAAEGQPWFLAVNFINPHDIMFFDATGEMEKTRLVPGMIAPMKGAPADPIFAQDWQVDLPKSFYADDLSTKPWAQRDETDRTNAIFGEIARDDHEAWRVYRNFYFNCVRHVDQQLGLVLDALKASGQADGTVVLFTSDHGERGGAHGQRQKGAGIYKENLRVPLIVSHPDVRGGMMTEALGSAVDLVPTLLGFAGADVARAHDDLPGFDLSPAVADGRARTARDEQGILFDYEIAGPWDTAHIKRLIAALKSGDTTPVPPPSLDLRVLFRGVHDGRYKFARYFAPSQHHTPVTWEQLTRHNDLELYDTLNDPDEIVNLAHTPEVHRELILKLNAQTNALVAREVGVDDGASLPGDTARYNQLSL